MYAGSTLRAHRARLHPPARWLISACLLLLAMLPVLLLGACGGNEPSESASPKPQLTVFAAASLTDAFTALGDDYMAAHPGTTVTFNFAGSQDLVAQLQQGATADVLATADTKTMTAMADAVGTPQTFAGNKLIIAVAPDNPKGITGLKALAGEDLKVVLAAPEVPAGKYAQQILEQAGVDVAPVSLEESVKGVVTKISLGEADAGIVYVTDVSAAGGKIDGVAIPEEGNVVATYPIALVTAGNQPQAAQTFVDYVLSSEGQQVLQSFGFLAPPAE